MMTNPNARHDVLMTAGSEPMLGGAPSNPSPKVASMPSNLRRLLSTLAVVGLATAGCDTLNPTEVTNPTVTESSFVGTPNSALAWSRGVERQLAVTMNQVLMGTEVVSDNLFNNRTLYSKVFDIPELDASDFDVRNIAQAVSRLRRLAEDGLNIYVPGDPNSTPQIRADLHFLRGYSHLLAGELFVALPGAPGGPLLTPSQHFAAAVADFDAAIAASSNAAFQNTARLGIARAHYGNGNRAAARTAAQAVRAAAPTLLRNAQFDQAGGATSTIQTAVYTSVNNEFQPLPRLDFLFPKYYQRSAGAQSPVAILKGEEAFLILAEAAISEGSLTDARAILTDLIGVVNQRPREMVNEAGQRRGRGGGTWIYPNNASILVAASPTDPPRAGLVLNRTAATEVPTVSGTSVTAAMLAAATTDQALLELLYLMRQEIFVLEGRRMTDLGIRFPLPLDEALTNPNISTSDAALNAQLPSFIPLQYGLDAFQYQDGAALAVITHNMNRVIVQNRTSPFVAPFH
jgi:hypothetical protein